MRRQEVDFDPAPEGDRSPRWVPPWVHLLGMPVWVTGPDGNVSYLNGRAEGLLGRTASECIGRPCHRVIGGRKLSGAPFCNPDCAVHRLAANKREIEPYPLRIPNTGRRDEVVRVVVIIARPTGSDASSFVHCVVDDARHERFKKYFTKIVARTPHHSGDLSLDRFNLTDRERQILQLLSEDETIHAIAHRLNLSYATVRNHVQHILNKLGVHSVLEAVAFYLLVTD